MVSVRGVGSAYPAETADECQRPILNGDIVTVTKRFIAVLALLALFGASCGSGSDNGDSGSTDSESSSSDDAASTADGDKPTINLVVNPWTASALNVQVAKQIIESEMGYPVEVVNLDENDAMFTGLSDGGTVHQDGHEEFWTPYFAVVTDAFGTPWQISVESEPPED